MVSHQGAVHHGAMANGHAMPDVAGHAFVAVDHHLVLEVGLLTHHDLVGLGAHHRSEEHDGTGPTVTSPMTIAVGATNAVGSIFGSTRTKGSIGNTLSLFPLQEISRLADAPRKFPGRFPAKVV